MREPAFWWRKAGPAAALLAPFAAAYGAIAARRFKRHGQRVGAPVICVGNLTVGGAGKTPLALSLAAMLQAAGERPALLTRGYGGKLAGPVRVDPAIHRAADVGDEPLLLARLAPTFVARDRLRGAQAALETGASIIVMDDGFQNPSLHKDLSILVVDGRRGIGNGCVIPAGPLRAPMAAQLEHADAIVMVGAARDSVAGEARRRGLPVLQAALEPDPAIAAGFGRALAFAGIGDPEKFFVTLANAGVAVASARSFPDHHRYTAAEARALCADADRDGLTLVTTEKDLVRLQGDAAAAMLAKRARALPVTLKLADPAAFARLMCEKIPRLRL
jgi:tetraacyldisaccharide 4'-kinase